MDFFEILLSVNFLLLAAGAGVILEILRKVLPDKIEKHKVFKIILPLLPFILATAGSFIPGLSPAENLAQSVVFGLLAGALAGSVYPAVKRFIKMFVKNKAAE